MCNVKYNYAKSKKSRRAFLALWLFRMLLIILLLFQISQLEVVVSISSDGSVELLSLLERFFSS